MASSEPDPQPNQPSDPPPSPPQKDWLRTVARATETVAPLVARQAPKADDIPADRRGRWATALAITGILMAVLQFLVQFYDLVTRPLAPLAGALPYLAAGLLLAAAGAGIYALLRARTRRQRLTSAAATLFILLVAGSWGGWLAYDTLRPPQGYRILISEFDGSAAGETIDFSRRIAETLRSQLADAGQPIEIKRTTAVFTDPETARRAGESQHAGMVIWGWYDGRGVSPHVEVLSLPNSDAQTAEIPLLFATANAAAPSTSPTALQPTLSKLAPVTRTPPALPSIDLFTAYGADQMTYVASAVLATSYLANADLERAVALYNQALENVAGDPTEAQGQEVVYYQRATANYRLGRYDAARADLEQALRLEPDYAPARLLLALVLADHCTPGRDLPAALENARRAAALAPGDPAAGRLLADLLLRSGDPGGALAAAQAALALAPTDIDTQNQLAAIYASLGREAESRAAREQALLLAQQSAGTPAAAEGDQADREPAPPSADVLYQLGDAYLALDRNAEALAAYTQAQAAAPTDWRIHQAKGNVYYWQGKQDQARAEYTAWAQADPANPEPLVMLGLLADEAGDTEAAAGYYAQAAALGPCDPAPYLLLGGAQTAAGDYDGAEASYAQALVVEPNHAAALFAAGANDLLRQEYAAAAAKFGELAGGEAPSAAAAYYWGEALDSLGDGEGAQRAYATVASLAEADPDAAADAGVYLAYAYEKLGRTDDAIAVYLRLLAAGETADLHAYLGMLYVEKGAPDLAQQEYERALALNPQHLPALYGQGSLAYARGAWAEAVAPFEAYLATYDSAEVHELAARSYQMLGDLPATLRHLQEAVQLDAGDPGLLQQVAYVANWLNRLDIAQEAAQSALRLRPADPGLYELQGQLAYKACDLAGAVASLGRSVELTPTNSFYAGRLGGYLLAQGDAAAVQPYLEQLRSAPASDYGAHWLAAALLLESAQLVEAGASTAITPTAITPTAAPTGSVPAAAFAQVRAEYALALAAPELPAMAAAAMHAALGSLAYLEGNVDAAADEFNTALALSPASADAEIGLGDLSLLTGDPAAAAEHYQRAQAALPAYAAAYSYDTAAIYLPLLHMRLALAARQAGDAPGEQAALEAAATALADLHAAAPDWASVTAAEGILALIRGDEAGAASAFARSIACDRTLAEAPGEAAKLIAAASRK